MSEHSVGGAWAAQVGMGHDRAPPQSGHAAVLGGGEAVWVQTGVVIQQRGAVCFSRGQRGNANPVTVWILRERTRRNSAHKTCSLKTFMGKITILSLQLLNGGYTNQHAAEILYS